jgi:L-alanine-DL-glutamate epimerase-like enolase superfamily enzyme
MKIIAIELLRASLPLAPPFDAAWDPEPRTSFNATVVKVTTDEGLVGFGSGDTMDGFEQFHGLFLGQDPMHIARHVRSLETISFHSNRYWPFEVALWDIIGKALGVPVATLFGGNDSSIPAYASTGRLLAKGPRVDSILAIKERGFKAAKIRIRPDDLEEGIATVLAVRAAVGPDFELMVDLNQSWKMAGDIRRAMDPVGVRRTARRLAEADIFWLEEPLPLDDISGLRSVRQDSGVRISGGEMVRTFEELLDLVENDALDVYQPDVVLAAGMHRVRTIAEVVRRKNRLFTPHTWSNGIGLLANLHVTAGVGGGPYIEYPLDPPTWTEERRDFMLTSPVRVGPDGLLRVPDAPGLGFEVDEDKLARLAVTAA